MPACRAGDVTGCLADEKWLGMKVPPLRLRFQRPPRSCYANPQWLQRKDSHLHRHEVTSSPAYLLAYSGMKMVEVEGLAPPCGWM